jgi:hypothetical protein
MSKRLLTLAAVLAAFLVFALVYEPRAQSDDVTSVRVTNFPSVQPIHGTVVLDAPTPHASLVRRENVVVPPIKRSEITNLVSAGTIQTEGYTFAILSLQGEMRAQVWEAGTVGAVLVPEEGPVQRAMRDGQRIQFPMEVSTKIDVGDSTFWNAEQVKANVGFGNYRVYFYNSTSKGVEANLYVYLCN